MDLRAGVHAIHVTALGVWAGALAMTGASAAVLFPTLKALHPTLRAYSGYPGDAEGGHGVLAAGHVAARLFAIGDAAGFVCALVAGATLLIGPALLGQTWRRGIFMVRACLLGTGLCLLAYQLMVLGPRMQTNLRGYWDRALAGEVDLAEQFRAAFAAEHPTASLVLVTTTLVVLAGAFLGALDRPERAGTPPNGT
ncbi:MAG: hypothetical protein AB7K52_12780 [Phycisphaerales bacterium]